MHFKGALIRCTRCLVAVCFIVTAAACSCGYNEVARKSSPDARFEAVATAEDCGATVLNFGVSLYQLPLDSRLPFMSSPREEVFSAGRAYHLQLQWLDNTHLVITCPGCSDVEVDGQRSVWNGVAVQYVPDHSANQK